jgi:lipopolysaccharide biosynthesis protein
MLPWDNTARYGSRAIVHVNGEGDAYKTWLTQALIDTYRRYPPDERIVFLHSWNEWCEGTYLEPDGKFGRMFLEQTGEAIQTVRQAIDLIEAIPEAVPAVAELLKVVQAKDEGAFRVMRATRIQTAHVWRELEKTRKDLANIVSARDQELDDVRASLASQERLVRAERDAFIQELEALRLRLSRSESEADLVRAHRDGIVASKSWRITSSLRAIAARMRRLS